MQFCPTTKTLYIDTFRTLMLSLVLINLYEIFTSYQWQPGNQKCVRKSLACFYFRRYKRYYRSFRHKCLFRNTWQNFIKTRQKTHIDRTHFDSSTRAMWWLYRAGMVKLKLNEQNCSNKKNWTRKKCELRLPLIF